MTALILGDVGGEEATEVLGEGDRPKSRSPSSNEALRAVSDIESSSLMSAMPERMLSMVKALSFFLWLAKLLSLPSSPTTSISSSFEMIPRWARYSRFSVATSTWIPF